jgi:hypothetical protein
MLFLRAIAIWLIILVLAIANGGLREAVLLPALGDPIAHLASGTILIVCILVVSYLLVPRLGMSGWQGLGAVGTLWLLLTLAFEFGFGRVVQGRSWSELLAAYTFQGGNIWPIVLAVTLVSPILVGQRRSKRTRDNAA